MVLQVYLGSFFVNRTLALKETMNITKYRPAVVGCGWEVVERVKKTTSVPKTKKKHELPMKLLDDPKNPTARRNPRRPHYFHKPLDVAVEMRLKPGRPYCTRRRHHHLNVAPTNLDPKNKKRIPQNRRWSPPTDEGRDPPRLHGPKERGDLRRRRREAAEIRSPLESPGHDTSVTFRVANPYCTSMSTLSP
jgi:hypothetical protein